ncbi:MAG: hypothetical protein J6866_05635, partial [Victivallales bacterium]|nr:hypothetical protein [Victivallales bacterium]
LAALPDGGMFFPGHDGADGAAPSRGNGTFFHGQRRRRRVSPPYRATIFRTKPKGNCQMAR